MGAVGPGFCKGRSPKRLTPQDYLDIVLRVCDELSVDSYTRYCTVLTAYAESDFNGLAKSARPVGASGYYSEGLFQQTLPWWPHDHFDPVASTRAFIAAFRRKIGNPVKDAWLVQRWQAPDPELAPEDFLWAKETINYTNRLERVNQIVASRKLP
jgi:hypothetical protein